MFSKQEIDTLLEQIQTCCDPELGKVLKEYLTPGLRRP